MITHILSRFSIGPFIIALLLGTLVVAAPIVNAKGRPPRAVFLILPDNVVPPTIDVEVHALGNGRFHLNLNTTGFVFTDICLLDAQAAPIGHAHVHVNGTKVTSAYVPIAQIGPLDPGIHTLDVVLRGQDHRPIIGRDGLVHAVVTVQVPVTPR